MLLPLKLPLPSPEGGLVCGGCVSIQPSVAKLIAISHSQSTHKCRIQVVNIKLIIEILAFTSDFIFVEKYKLFFHAVKFMLHCRTLGL